MGSDAPDEFWDYEHQVDLEAFSSSTFYSLLLQQSRSVTVQLGRLTAEVFTLTRISLALETEADFTSSAFSHPSRFCPHISFCKTEAAVF